MEHLGVIFTLLWIMSLIYHVPYSANVVFSWWRILFKKKQVDKNLNTQRSIDNQWHEVV